MAKTAQLWDAEWTDILEVAAMEEGGECAREALEADGARERVDEVEHEEAGPEAAEVEDCVEERQGGAACSVGGDAGEEGADGDEHEDGGEALEDLEGDDEEQQAGGARQ